MKTSISEMRSMSSYVHTHCICVLSPPSTPSYYPINLCLSVVQQDKVNRQVLKINKLEKNQQTQEQLMQRIHDMTAGYGYVEPDAVSSDTENELETMGHSVESEEVCLLS